MLDSAALNAGLCSLLLAAAALSAALDSLLYLNKRYISKGALTVFVKRATRELRKVPTDDPKITALLLKVEDKLRALSR